MEYDCSEFKRFIDLKEDQRKDFILSWLKDHGLSPKVITIGDKNHILLQFDPLFYDSHNKIKTIVAHYDRANNSPGANDNSSSVWILMNWALTLNYSDFSHNVRIIFTDGEELGQNGVQDQGAFLLAKKFSDLGLDKGYFFVFDSIGRGTVPVLCNNGCPENGSDFSKKMEMLFSLAKTILDKATDNSYAVLPASYSDNASFLINGIPCVAFTMLPEGEVMDYKKSLELKSDYVPKTWQYFHTPEDNLENLDPLSIPVMEKILAFVAKLK